MDSRKCDKIPVLVPDKISTCVPYKMSTSFPDKNLTKYLHRFSTKQLNPYLVPDIISTHGHDQILILVSLKIPTFAAYKIVIFAPDQMPAFVPHIITTFSQQNPYMGYRHLVSGKILSHDSL